MFQHFQCSRKISLAALHLEAALGGDNFDRPVFAIRIEVRWLISQRVLVAESFLDLTKSFGQLALIACGQNVPSGGSGKQIQHSFAFWVRISDQIIRAEGEHQNFSASRGLLGVVHERATCRIHAIGNENDRSPRDLGLLIMPQPIAREDHGVI